MIIYYDQGILGRILFGAYHLRQQKFMITLPEKWNQLGTAVSESVYLDP